MGECPYRPFTDLIEAVVDNRGRTCPTSDQGVPLIATNCIGNDRLYPSYEKVRYVSEDVFETWFRGHPQPGDLIFVCKGSPGRVSVAPHPVDFCIAQDMVAIRADPAEVYPRYLFAALRSDEVQTQIASLHVGSLIPHFKKGDFGKLKIPVPDRRVQRAIGDLYFDMSRKVAVNLRVVGVSFDLMQELWASEAQISSSSMQFATLASLDKGVSYKGAHLGSGVPMVNLGNFGTNGRFNGRQTKRYSGEARSSHWVEEGELVLANTDLTQRREILGQPAIVATGSERSLISHHVFAVRIRQEWIAEKLWLYAALRDLKFRRRATTYAAGTTVASLPRDAVLTYQVPWPAQERRRAWSRNAERLLASADAAIMESSRLEELRDAMLRPLMSGQLRIKDAEKIVEDST